MSLAAPRQDDPTLRTPNLLLDDVARALATRLAEMNVLINPVWVFDIDNTRVLWANLTALNFWNAENLEQLIQRDMGRDMSPTVARRLKQYQADFRQGSSFTESYTLYPKGQPKTIRCMLSGIVLADGRVAMLVQGSVEQVETPDALRSIQALLHTSAMIALYDLSGALLYCNPAAREQQATNGTALTDHFEALDDYQRLRDGLDRQGEVRQVARVHTQHGVRWHEIDARLTPDAISGSPAILASEIDVTDRVEAERQARYLSLHDGLTGLPNRSCLEQKLLDELSSPIVAMRRLAFLFIDLDRFKTINDSLGHAMGDRLLVEIGQRLRACVRTRDRDMVVRLGGDEFVVVLNDIRDVSEAKRVASEIQQCIAEPVFVSEHELRITASIGVSLFPDHGKSVGSLMKHADLAMYAAKGAGRDQTWLFEPTMMMRARQRLSLEIDLRRALKHDEFELFYQPRVTVKNNQLVGAEALVRWRHPVRGLLKPDAFIAAAEESGLIEPIGRWVLSAAAKQQQQWQASGFDLLIAVNLSARQLGRESFLKSVNAIIEETECDPKRLEFEITESMLMNNSHRVRECLEALDEMGISLAVDDFGTGYSNLAYLRDYPIRCLKIDRSFIASRSSWPLVEAILGMSRFLRVRSIAEGVEEMGQLEWLRDRGCDEYQGYYFSAPLPASDLLSKLWQRSKMGE